MYTFVNELNINLWSRINRPHLDRKNKNDNNDLNNIGTIGHMFMEMSLAFAWKILLESFFYTNLLLILIY